MQIDIFSEMQRPRELWDDDAYEHTLIEETLEQARLADELGYGCWWQVEHHGAVEFSYSSAPEMMLTAIARGTERLRVGHSAVLSPHRFNHPIRVAERAAFLDHLSDGRLELGLARSTVKEWRAFNIDGDETREQMQQAFELIPQLWTRDSVNWDSEDFRIQDFTLTPKPLQDPLPIMIGGRGERRTIPTMVRWGHEWNGWCTVDDMRYFNALIDRLCDAAGRDPATIARSAAVILRLCDSEAEAARLRRESSGRPVLVGTPEQLVEQVADYAAAGTDELIIPDFNLRPDEAPEVAERFMAEVVAAL